MWSLSDDFPINTEHPLTVSFNDDNGDITLGTVEKNLATGSNSAQMVFIEAQEFDTQRWDDDSDGVSNFDELNQGTDPLEANLPLNVEEISPRDTVFFGWTSQVATYYEPEIKLLELPAEIHDNVFVDRLPFTSTTTVTDIVIDSGGNGTYRQTFDYFIALDMPYKETSIGTRSVQDGTVKWSGRASEHVFETSNTIDDRTLIQPGNGTVTLRRDSSAERANIISYDYHAVLDLDSIDESGTCSILTGSSYYYFDRNIESVEFSESSVSRESSEDKWAWSETVDGASTSGEGIENISRFHCDFEFLQTGS